MERSGLSSATTSVALGESRGNAFKPVPLRTSAPAATPIARPASTSMQSAPMQAGESVVPVALSHERGARPRLTYTVNADIKGYGSLAAEDRQPVSELMFWTMSIKCQDGNYASESYARPKFWRVETLSSGDYLLIVGGWDDVDFEDLAKIKKWDPQPEGSRNIIGISMKVAPENDPPHNHYMSIVIRYRREEERRRRVSAASDFSAPSDDFSELARTQMGAPSKKRGLVADVVSWVAYGSGANRD